MKLLGPSIDSFLYATSKKAHGMTEDPESAIKLLDWAISVSTSAGVKTTPKLCSIIQVKFNICYGSLKEFHKALECAEIMAEKSTSQQELEAAVKMFVNAKRKLLENESIRVKNLPKSAEKLEIRTYRLFQEFVDVRQKMAENLHKTAKTSEDKVMALNELIWIKFSLRKDKSLQYGINLVEKAKKLLSSIEDSKIQVFHLLNHIFIC